MDECLLMTSNFFSDFVQLHLQNILATVLAILAVFATIAFLFLFARRDGARKLFLSLIDIYSWPFNVGGVRQ